MRLLEIMAVEYEINTKMRKEIKKAAMDPHQVVHKAAELVNQIYRDNNVEIPKLLSDENYEQYHDNLIYAITCLDASTNKGIRDASWKLTFDEDL